MDSWAILWDVDGTLVDTAELHFQAWCALARELQQPFTRAQFNGTFGWRNPEIIPLLFGGNHTSADVDRLGNRKEDLYRAEAMKGVDLLPGVLLGQAEPAGDGIGQQLRIPEPGQLHDPHAVGVIARRIGYRPQRHARLADAPWPDDGHEPGVAEELGQVQELCLPAYEIGNRGAHLGYRPFLTLSPRV